MGEQQKLLLDYATRLDENDKKSEETSRKFSTLLQVNITIKVMAPLVFCLLVFTLDFLITGT